MPPLVIAHKELLIVLTRLSGAFQNQPQNFEKENVLETEIKWKCFFLKKNHLGTQ